jgi:hypothetical protein
VTHVTTIKRKMEHTPAQKLQFIDFFKKNATDVGKACKAFGISRKTFYEWMKAEDTTFRDAIEEARDEIKDFGESQLLLLMRGIPKVDADGKLEKWIERPDTAAVIFFNKTKNKDRGYDERHIIKPEGGLLNGSININVGTPEQAKVLKEFLSNGTAEGSQPK